MRKKDEQRQQNPLSCTRFYFPQSSNALEKLWSWVKRKWCSKQSAFCFTWIKGVQSGDTNSFSTQCSTENRKQVQKHSRMLSCVCMHVGGGWKDQLIQSKRSVTLASKFWLLAFKWKSVRTSQHRYASMGQFCWVSKSLQVLNYSYKTKGIRKRL